MFARLEFPQTVSHFEGDVIKVSRGRIAGGGWGAHFHQRKIVVVFARFPSVALILTQAHRPCAGRRAPERYARIALALPGSVFGQNGRVTMKNPLDTLWGTVISGLAVTFVLYSIVRAAIGG